MSIAKDNLIAARELIADPAHWTTGTYARHKNGNSIGPEESNACQWCSIGALRKVMGSPAILCVTGSEGAALSEQMDGFDIASFNDTRTHAAVIAAWDRAIEATP